MNRRQIVAMWWGIAVLVLMWLIPPWRTEYNLKEYYPFIGTIPGVLHYERHRFQEIDFKLLVCQSFIVILLTGGAIATRGSKP